MPIRAKSYRPPHYAVTRRQADTRKKTSARGYGAKWRKLRNAWLTAAPRVCEECGKTGNLHVHHRIPHGGAPDLLYEWGNLMTLCGVCHNRHHMLERHHAS